MSSRPLDDHLHDTFGRRLAIALFVVVLTVVVALVAIFTVRESLKPLTSDNATLQSSSLLDVYLTNTGQTKIADLDKWDVIVHYYDAPGNHYVNWLPYNPGVLGNNEWQKTAIYLNGQPEAFEPDILNPGESIKIAAKLSPPVGPGTTNEVIISTPNGIPATAYFTR